MGDQSLTLQFLREFIEMGDDRSDCDIDPEINVFDSFSPLDYKDSEENELPSNQSNNEEEGRRSLSKPVLSERMRRGRLNERLCSLRSQVPNISKLTKTSVLCDAIEYVRHLQKQVKDAEADILRLQSEAMTPKIQYPRASHDGENPEGCNIQLLEVNVSTLGGRAIFNITAYSKRGGQVSVQIIRAFASLKLEIQCANFTCFNEHIISTIITQINSKETVHPNKLKEMFVEAAAINGFETSPKMRIE